MGPEGGPAGTYRRRRGWQIAYILAPTVGALLAIWVMRDYDVTEERAKEIRAELERRRGRTLITWRPAGRSDGPPLASP